MSKVLALARITAREILGQPLTRIACGATSLLLLLATGLPSFTFEPEGDLKFMTDVGAAGVALCLLVVGLWPATTILADELSRRTAMTILSKPVPRRDYLLGRTLGILGALAAAAAALAAVLLLAVWLTEGEVVSARLDRLFEPGLDGPVQAAAPPAPPVRWRLVGVVLLGLGQAGILSAVAVAVSTRLGGLPNLACCGAVFLLGHLGGGLAQARGSAAWLGRALRLVLPDLECFDASEAIALGVDIPMGVVAGSLLYAALYASAVLAAAVPLFERRELT